MTSLKTKNICFLAAFLFLVIVPTLAKVVNEVKDCKQFLYQGTPPEIPGVLVGGNIQDNNRYKIICQTYGDEPRFLTVYDTKNRIPVFSAYKYKERQGPEPDKNQRVPWKIEPQLELGTNLGDNMMKEDSNINYNNQAVDNDYKKAEKKKGQEEIKYDRGHLFPNSHASGPDKAATFTLTNAVPQDHTFNGQRWSPMEQRIKCVMDYYISKHKSDPKYCFVVTGAQPSDNYLNEDINNNDNDNNKKKKVNIPSMMWSAFYCDDKMSGAYWGNNDATTAVHDGTLEDLKNNSLTKDIKAFPGATTIMGSIRDFFATILSYCPFK